MIKIILVSIVLLLVAARPEGRHHPDRQIQATVQRPVYQPFSQEQIEKTKRKIEAMQKTMNNPADEQVDIEVEDDDDFDVQFFTIAIIAGTVFVICRICVAIRRNNRINRQLRERSRQQLLQPQPIVMQQNIHQMIQYHQQELNRLHQLLQQQPVSNVQFQYAMAPQCVEPIVQGYYEPQETIPVGRPVNRYH